MVVQPFGKIGNVGIQVVFNILTSICTEVNHCVVSIHDYLTVLQTVGKVVNVYQKKKRPKDASLGYPNRNYLLSRLAVLNRFDLIPTFKV